MRFLAKVTFWNSFCGFLLAFSHEFHKNLFSGSGAALGSNNGVCLGLLSREVVHHQQKRKNSGRFYLIFILIYLNPILKHVSISFYLEPKNVSIIFYSEAKDVSINFYSEH